MSEKKNAESRRQFLRMGLKALALAVPVVGFVVAQPKQAEAAWFRRRCRRSSGGGCSTCG